MRCEGCGDKACEGTCYGVDHLAEIARLGAVRDALRAALEKIARLPIYGHDPQDAIALATAAITAAKGTP